MQFPIIILACLVSEEPFVGFEPIHPRNQSSQVPTLEVFWSFSHEEQDRVIALAQCLLMNVLKALSHEYTYDPLTCTCS